MTTSTKIAIFSDLHLGVHQNSDFWHKISVEWCTWFVADVKSRGIETVYFLGDFFHHRDFISVKTIHVAHKILSMFEGLNLKMIVGNHDCFFKDKSTINSVSILNGYDFIDVVDELKYVSYGGKTFALCPWGVKVKDVKDADVVFGHFEITSFFMNTYRVCDHGEDYTDFENFSLVFSGHFHKRQTKQISEKSKVLYVGNPFQTDFNDIGNEKGYHIFDTQTKDVEFIENVNTPKHLQTSLSTIIKLTDIKEDFKVFTNNIVKLVVDKNISIKHMNILLSRIKDFNPIDVRVDYDVNYKKVRIEEEIADLSGLNIEHAITEFVDMVDIKQKGEVVKFVLDLYNSCK